MSKQAMLTMSAVAALCVLATLSIQARAAGQQEGMIAVRDKDTGQLRAATPDEIKALRAATPPGAALTGRPQTRPQAVFTRPNGAHGVRIGDSHKVFEVVTRGADGKLSSQCVQGEGAAQEALTHPANAADKESAHESR